MCHSALHANRQPEFAGCDLLMMHLLTGSDQDFELAARRWAESNIPCNKNAFGQSALHLAVMLPKRLKKLFELGMSPDAVDRDDTTPLMYAATYGQLDSILDLIDHGADMGKQDTVNQRFFVDYAMVHGHVNLIAKLVGWLRESSDSELALLLIDRCVRWTFAQTSMWADCEVLECLFRLRGDSDVSMGSTTSMHLARSVEEAHLVLRHDFTGFGVSDEHGETPLMRVSRFRDTGLLRAVFDKEPDVDLCINQQDLLGWTALMHLTNCLDERRYHQLEENHQSSRASAVGCLNMLLSRGANVTYADKCNCPCSPGGCSGFSIAMHRAVESLGPWDSANSISVIPLDFAIALQTCTDSYPQWAIDAAKTFVDFIETGEMHTCCARRRVRSGL
jgi:ankyrin repeat protein